MSTDNILNNFRANVESVKQLAAFDNVILEFAIHALQTCIDKLRQHGVDSRYMIPQNALANLQNIHRNSSLRPRYEDMFNQCIVLLVSHLSYSLEELFRANVQRAIPKITSKRLLSERIHVSIADLQSCGYNLADQIGEWIIRKKDISFQDMQSVRRTFADYFNVEIQRDDDMNNIILAQASRHIIAHRAGVVNKRFKSQIQDAMPRTVKQSLPAEGKIQFEPCEIQMVADSMSRFFTTLASAIEERNGEGKNGVA